MAERVEVQCDDCDAEVWHDLHEWDNEVQENNMDEQYIQLLKELLNNVENSISQAVETNNALESAESEIYSLQYTVEEAIGQVSQAKSDNEQVIIDLEELHADVETEIIKEQNNAINAR